MTLRANELRIGNRAVIEGNEVTVDGRVICDIWTGEITDVEPIPLTEEWLKKLGFYKDDSGVEPYRNDYCEWYQIDFPIIGTLSTSDKWDGKGAGYIFDENSDKLRIKYVHQLQNLYYALTGEELTTK